MVIKADSKLCVGCRACELACSIENFGVHNPKRSRIRIEEQFPIPARYVVHVCQQCVKPKCVPACPYGSLVEEKTGRIVLIDDGKACLTCEKKQCTLACPFGAAFYYKGKALVCTDCGACLKVCPRGVLKQIKREAKE